MNRHRYFGYTVFVLLLLLSPFGCNKATFAEPTNTPTQIPPTSTFTPVPPTPTSLPTPTSPPRSEAKCLITFTQVTQTGSEIFVADCSINPPKLYQATEMAGGAYLPHISPDSQYIAFLYQDPQTGLENFWVIDHENDAEVSPLSYDGINFLRDYSWSNDSRYLIYCGPQPNGGELDIYRFEIATGEIVNLTEKSPVWDAFPKWSPTEDQIAFVSDRSDVTGKTLDNIWLMASDGTNLRNLTHTELWENNAPGWSPDGEEIAFFRYRLIEIGEEDRGPGGLWVVNLKTGKERLLIKFDEMVHGFDAPVWSPDGKYIAYLLNLSPEMDVYVFSIESGISTNVSNLPGDEFEVSWSPDSQRLLFTHSTDDNVENWRLYTVRPDGTDLQPLFDFEGNALGEWFQ